MDETRKALTDLYQLIKDYDLEIEIAESAIDIDRRSPLVDGFRQSHEYERVVGILAVVRAELEIGKYLTQMDAGQERLW